MDGLNSRMEKTEDKKNISGLEIEHRNYPVCTQIDRIKNNIVIVEKSMAGLQKIKHRIAK